MTDSFPLRGPLGCGNLFARSNSIGTQPGLGTASNSHTLHTTLWANLIL